MRVRTSRLRSLSRGIVSSPLGAPRLTPQQCAVVTQRTDGADPGVCPPLPRSGPRLGRSLERLGADRRHPQCPGRRVVSRYFRRPIFQSLPLPEVRVISRVVGLVGAMLCMASSGNAQAPAHEDHPAHGAGLGELGKVTFPVSCAPEAGRRFETAMGALHSFWWEEGDAAFKRVLEPDAKCAMAYWGVAMNAWGNPFAGGPAEPALARGAEAAAKASSMSAKTARERGFIAAVAALYRDADKTPNAVRLQAYADTMARVYRVFPKDVEVAIYHALALIATAPKTDTT